MKDSFIYVEDKILVINFLNNEKTAKIVEETGRVWNSILNIDFRKRRSFCNDIEYFKTTLEYFFDKCPEYCIPYIDLYVEINKGYYNEENRKEIIDLLSTFLDDSPLIQMVFDFVIENYNITIEDPEKDIRQLQFNDLYAKRILMTSVLSRLTLPLIFFYIDKMNLRKDDELQFNMVSYGFSKFNTDDEGNPLNMSIKLQKYVDSVVQKTLYSDKVIWNYVESMGLNPIIVGLQINNVLVCNIVPKLLINNSIVSYLSVVTTKQLEFLFSKNFAVDYRPIAIIKNDNENSSPLTRIENRILKNKSELDLRIIHNTLKKFFDLYEDIIDKTLLEWYLDNITIHSAQVRLLKFFINEHLGNEVCISMLSKEQYVKLCLLAKSWYEYNGYSYIGWLIFSKPHERNYLRRNFRKGKLLMEIITSRTYKSLKDEYTFLSEDRMEEVVVGFIAEISNTNFVSYEYPYGTYSDGEETHPATIVAQLLDYIETL